LQEAGKGWAAQVDLYAAKLTLLHLRANQLAWRGPRIPSPMRSFLGNALWTRTNVFGGERLAASAITAPMPPTEGLRRVPGATQADPMMPCAAADSRRGTAAPSSPLLSAR